MKGSVAPIGNPKTGALSEELAQDGFDSLWAIRLVYLPMAPDNRLELPYPVGTVAILSTIRIGNDAYLQDGIEKSKLWSKKKNL